jgi:hypothetical protein
LCRGASARAVIFDVEPLVAYWDSGQDALERGVALIVTRACQLREMRGTMYNMAGTVGLISALFERQAQSRRSAAGTHATWLGRAVTGLDVR